MNRYLSSVLGWFGWAGGALGERRGDQVPLPAAALVDGVRSIGIDQALQLSTVWACVDRRAKIIASLPFFVYETDARGQRTLARGSRLYQLLHDSPNARMTPYQFWTAMMLNHDLKGNAYARIDRAPDGEAVSLWPMPADQVKPHVFEDGSLVYLYRVGNDVAALAEENVLHLKDLGNGTVGLSRLDYMRATTSEAARAQEQAQRVFGDGGKPTGVLMLDSVLKDSQRKVLLERFAEMSLGNAARLYLLEANMKYQQLSMSPADQQLLESRRFSVEEICRWFDVPPVLIHHSNVTTWGSGVEQLVDGFYKLTVRPILVSIEQAVRKRVQTSEQRVRLTAEINFDALLRGSAKDRMAIYATAVQNGLKTRNECRQLENDPPILGGDQLTAQSNLVPLHLLGTVKPTPEAPNAATQNTVAQ
ncbi:phage portal protein [Eleftheria terrae]|uniref:phage portal protein n=1 Tax=Eleftheria terrae TaxID=1597781 RepID=UPI00263B783A|nr:phage portal protein [Eleftheria terrae]WKB52303.1 phage portal protein [Eleftheria terrae]